MRLHYWQTAAPPNNFGDELDPWLWPRELGPRVLGDDGPWLVGIGSLLGDVLPFPDGELKLVMGSGAGYGTPPALDASWRIYAVRGPRTARLLGLPPDTVATDPGILARRHFPWASVPRETPVALMLHWRSTNDAWRTMAADLGWRFVDSRAGPERAMRLIAGTGLLLTEALHGAVVADAFQVPWTPLRTSEEILPFKWGGLVRFGGAPVRTGTGAPTVCARHRRQWRRPRPAGAQARAGDTGTPEGLTPTTLPQLRCRPGARRAPARYRPGLPALGCRARDVPGPARA